MYWSLHFTGGPRRVNHAATVVGPNIYTFGGFCTWKNQYGSSPMDVHCFNTFFCRWQQLFTQNEYPELFLRDINSVPFKRYGHTVVTYKDGIYLWGGRNLIYDTCNKLYCYHANPRHHNDNYWSVVKVYGPVPDCRDGHAACVYQDSMYIFGGYSKEMCESLDSLWQLNFLTSSWSRVAAGGDIPHKRDFHSLTAHGNKLYVFGGRHSGILPHVDMTHSVSDNAVYCFDIENKQWNEVAKTSEVKPSGRRSHSAFVYENGLYIFGGTCQKDHVNSVYRLDLSEYKWSEIVVSGAYPCPRERQMCVMFDDRMFLFGGMTPKSMAPHGQWLSSMQEIANYHSDYEEQEEPLITLNDLHVMDFIPVASLRYIAMRAVINSHIDFADNDLPWDVIQDIDALRPSKV